MKLPNVWDSFIGPSRKRNNSALTNACTDHNLIVARGGGEVCFCDADNAALNYRSTYYFVESIICKPLTDY